MPDTKSPNAKSPEVGLFITCLVDMMRPTVGFSALELLENAGCQVSVPETQTCCGQPGYNSGDSASAALVARATIKAFEKFDYIVIPSGSCAGMIKHHYPLLFEDDPDFKNRAEALAAKTFELISFLNDILKTPLSPVSYQKSVTYHDSCAGLRELGIKQQPRKLLGEVENLELIEMETPEECCGFGGTFCVKYPEISGQMVDKKVDDILSSGAETVVAGDLGCLMNIAGRLKRRGSAVQVRHVAEILAGNCDRPAIGEDKP